MAPSAPAFCVALLLAASLAGVRPAPQAASTASCSTDIVRLLPCLSFVSGEVPAPPDTCCANLGSMVHDEPQCLCQALSQPGTSPVAVNMSRVLGLPRLCRLDLPSAPGAACAALLPPGPAPPLPAIAPRPSANSTAPSPLTPAAPAAPQVTPPPRMGSGHLPGISRGSKVIADGVSVALGFVALVSALTF